MADEQNQSGDKTEDPSLHRIEEFRKKGDVASSRELTSMAIVFAGLLTTAVSLGYLHDVLRDYIQWMFQQNLHILIEERGSELLNKSIFTFLKCIAPFFGVIASVSLIIQVMQIGFLFAPDVLQLKWERVNPINGLKRLISLKAFFEALKAIFKFIIILLSCYLLMRNDIHNFNGFLQNDFVHSFSYLKGYLIEIVSGISLGLLVIAFLDFSYQKYSHWQKLRMTKQELKEESKQYDGNPEIKQRIRNIQKQLSQKRMMKDVPRADVIVTNPTHYSVALKYDPKKMVSPIVLAKGVDFSALKIREIAKEHSIPIVENVNLARGLYREVEIGQYIPRDLYQAVAELLAFVYKMKKKRGAWNQSDPMIMPVKNKMV
jgi:flagellar biosynthetic protein FlhB